MSVLTTAHRVTLPCGELRLDVQEHPDWPLDALLRFGLRQNPRRGYLLISCVLGKHIPAPVTRVQAAHRALARRLPAEVPGPVLFVGLAETATQLGEGVAREWAQRSGRTDFTFLHTTRYRLAQAPALTFQEPHSHASTHLLYRPDSPDGERHFDAARTLVLIDDELSTGTTLQGLATAYRQLNSHLRGVMLVSLTDLCPRHDEVQATVGLSVQRVSLLSGALHFTPDPAYTPPALPAVTGNGHDKSGLLAQVSARTGQDAGGSPLMRQALERLTQLPPHQDVLLLGTGEFQYLPYLLGGRLQQRRPDVQVLTAATTRSPVQLWGGVGEALTFTDNYHDGIPNYLYNVTPGQVPHVYVGYEGRARPDPALLDALGAAALQLA